MRSNDLSTALAALRAGALVASALLVSGCASAAADPDKLSAEQRAAVEVAKRTLGSTGAAHVESVEAREWSDSSLGCPQRGVNYMQVITPGYLVKLTVDGVVHEVRVAGENAVICPTSLSGQPRRAAPAHRITNLDVMEKQAVADLAQRLGVEPSALRVARRLPQRWPDDTLECAAQPGKERTGDAVPGFKLVLRHQERFYTYHTDLKRVMACPPIEAQ